MKIARILGIFALAGLLCAGSPQDSIYYRSQAEADAALAAFDHDHPQCQLWTNWQKMCFRTGRELGQLHCVSDSAKPVAPSHPFCAGWDGNVLRVDRVVDDVASISAARFCRNWVTRDGKRACTQMSPKRPFSGSSLDALQGPYCDIWGTGGRPLCKANGSDVDLPECSQLPQSVRRGRRFYCVAPNQIRANSRGCTALYDATHINEPGSAANHPNSSGEVLPLAYRRLAEPVVRTVFCADYRSH